ncbi:MAG: SBBP repeat-containing protein, partial [Bacteroidota bacterium]
MRHTLLLCIIFFGFNFTGSASTDATNRHANIPCSITENKGQFTDESGNGANNILAKITLPHLDVYITRKGVSYVLLNYEEDRTDAAHPVYFNEVKYKTKYSRVDVDLPGSVISRQQLVFSNQADWQSNHYRGGEAIKAVSHYQKLTVKNIYPGVDWVWSITPAGKLEYDFVVHPGADAAVIKMKYNYADLSPQGKYLSIVTHNGALKEGPLVASSENAAVDISYQLNPATKEISFTTGAYDRTKDFIIDPPLALQWSAQYGGIFVDGFRGVSTDTAGYVYITGYTNSFNFPSFNPGGSAYYDGVFNGVVDAIILKIDSNQGLKWATYLGGPGDDFGNSIHVDEGGRVYVTGGAEAGFPLVTLGGAYNQTGSTAQEAFVARFDSTLNLTWSTFYGGAGNEEGLKIHTDLLNNIYVCGFTNSPSGSFPTRQLGGGFIQTNVIGSEAFVLRFTATGANDWATVYGGTGDDVATSLATDLSNNVVVIGFTSSSGFPVSPGGGAYYQNSSGGNTDGFILRFRPNTFRVSGSYFGGNSSDYFTDVTLGAAGSFFFTGRTSSTNFPLNAAPGFGFNQSALAGSFDAFIVKCNNDLSLWWSSYYGGTAIDAGTGVACDNSGKLYLTGFTFSNDFPLDSPLFAGAYYQPVNYGMSEGFVAGFSNMAVQFWSTYKGDSCYEYPADIAFDNTLNNFYVVGEGMFSCSGYGGSGTSMPDTGIINAGGSMADAFAWAFDDGSATVNNGGGGGGGGGSDCFEMQLINISDPCPQQCNGSATLSITGGTPPFTVIWSSGEGGYSSSQLCEGPAWVQAQDATGCVGEALFQLQSMFISYTFVGVGCYFDYGSATVTPYGGVAPYTYLWADGTTDASLDSVLYPGGFFDVTVTDGSGCDLSTSIEIPFVGTSSGHSIEIINAPTCGQNNGIIVGTGPDFNPEGLWSVYTMDTSYTVYADTLFNVGFDTWYSIFGGFDCWIYGTFPVEFHVSTLDSAQFITTVNNPTTCNSTDGNIFFWAWFTQPVQDPLVYQWSTGGAGQGVNNIGVGDYAVTVTDALGCSTTLTFDVNSNDSVTVDFNSGSILLPSCQNDSTGGFNTPAITGGTAPYSYIWSNGATGAPITNLPAGIYSVTITDANGCTAEQSGIELEYENGSYIAFDSIRPECFGASNGLIAAQVITNFGNLPYSYVYRWSTGMSGSQINNIAPGTYAVTVEGNGGISYNACITLSNSISQFTAQIQNPPYDCLAGNNASANVSGGQFPYTYLWSDGSVSGANAVPFTGDLVLEVTDAVGCMAADTQSVVIGAPFTASYLADDILCNGGSAVINVAGSGGFTPYTGSGSYTVAAGNYNYVVSDFLGCSVQLQVAIQEPAEVTPVYTASPISCFGGQSSVAISATGGVGPYTGTGNFIYDAGTYNVTVTDDNGCPSTLSVQISSPAQLLIDVQLPVITCGIDTLVVNVSAIGGTGPYTGTGNFIFTADASFTFSVSDLNGCLTDSLVTIELTNDSNVTHYTNDTVCTFDNVFLGIDKNIQNPVWYPDSSTGHSYPLYGIDVNTMVRAVGTSADGCLVTEIFNIAVENCNTTGIGIVKSDFDVQLYPNPASSLVILEIRNN